MPRDDLAGLVQERLYLCGVSSCAGWWSRRVTSGGILAVTENKLG